MMARFVKLLTAMLHESRCRYWERQAYVWLELAERHEKAYHTMTQHNNALRKRIADLVTENEVLRSGSLTASDPATVALAGRVKELKDALIKTVRRIQYGSMPPLNSEVKALLALARKD
jgi:hypothetical protein